MSQKTHWKRWKFCANGLSGHWTQRDGVPSGPCAVLTL